MKGVKDVDGWARSSLLKTSLGKFQKIIDGWKSGKIETITREDLIEYKGEKL